MTERKTRLGGRYELDQIIGRGGMAEVWRARDTRLERDVAVKRLRVGLASDPTFQARFRREAHSAAGLNHPNIVAVYDTGEEIDQNSDVSVPYIVMELVEGVTLRDVLRDGRKVVPERALEFSAGVLDALAYSHRAGIIHRDIKPANVMLTPSGSIKVMDFGIARAVADTSATMTQTAAVIGTAQYLSPEQARGEKVDNRSDLYAVGCLLYELLTSQPPFTGDSPVSVAYQHVREQPVPPSQVDPEVNASMDAIVLKALAKDRNDRYQDAREFREDVIRAMNGQPVRATLADGQDGQATALMAPSAAAAAATTTRPQRAVSPAPPEVPEVVEAETEGEEEEEEKKSKAGIIVLSVLSGLVLIALGVALYMIYGNSEPEPLMKSVPTVVNEEQASAEKTLRNEGFVPVVDNEVSTEVEAGRVIRQDPEGGDSAEEGSDVTIWISSGEETGTIPDGLVGMTQAEAEAALAAADFTNVVTEDDDPATEDTSADAGDVTSSDPAPGATDIALSQRITLTIATGNSIVPNFEGMSQTEAQTAAEDNGFTIRFEPLVTNEHADGEVFGQDQDAGQPLERGTEINANIAVGVDTSTIPDNLVGMTVDQATAALRDADFTGDIGTQEADPANEPIDAEPGTVTAVNPPAGQSVEVDTAITLTVATGNSIVPDLTGMTEARATDEAAQAGFEINPDYVPDDGQTPGNVFDQTPEPGATHPRSEPIQIAIAIEEEDGDEDN